MCPTIMKKRKSYIWVARIPEVFGYGIVIFEKNEADALKALKKAYYMYRKGRQYTPVYTFKEAMEYYGGGTKKLELGKDYDDTLY